MKYLLDTCVISDFVKGEPGTVDRLLELRPHDLAVSSITIFEVAYGLELNKQRARRLRPKLEVLFDSVHALDFDRSDGAEAAHVRAELRRRGTPIGPYDVLLAGTARHRNLTLVTANTDEFSRVAGLQSESWRAIASP